MMSVTAVTVRVMSVTVKGGLSSHDVGRWEANSRGRLQEAALTLFAERGFDQTTAAQIAAVAGLTERTFFRHFADKREVLFAGSEQLTEQVVRLVVDVAPPAPPLAAVTAALSTAFGDQLGGFLPWARQRQAVIAANPELREREVAKLGSLTTAIAGALERRGVDGPTARLAAEAGMVAFRVAFDRWIADDLPAGEPLGARIRRCAAELGAVTADPLGLAQPAAATSTSTASS